MVRITNFHKFNIAQNQMSNIENAQNKLFEQVITGTVLNRASDDPVKFNESLMLERAKSKLRQYQSNLGDAKNLLEKMEVVYGSTIDAIHLVKTDITRASTETMSETDRDIIADMVDEIIEQIESFANTKHLDRYMFSGQKLNTQPIKVDGDTITYSGDGNRMTINISETMSVDVSQSADEVFGDILSSLIETRNAIRSNDTTAIQEGAGKLDKAFTEFIDNRSRMGVQLTSVKTMEDAYEETMNDFEIKKEDSLGTNMVKVFSDFKQLEFMHQAAIHSTISMNNTSILNFL